MKQLVKSGRMLAACMAMTALCSTAHTMPTTTINFTPGNGQLGFPSAGCAAEFDNTPCDTCVATSISCKEPAGTLWTNLNEITAFSPRFSLTGELVDWSVSLVRDLTSQVVGPDHVRYTVGTVFSASANAHSQSSSK